MQSHVWRARTAAMLAVVVAALAGCADSEPTSADPPAEPDAASPPTVTDPDAADTSEETGSDEAEDDVQVIEVTITAGQAHTEQSRVDVPLGSVVRIEVHADADEEVHVHGYDLFAPVGAAEPAVLEFTADIPGVFEVEAEHSGLELFQLRVR